MFLTIEVVREEEVYKAKCAELKIEAEAPTYDTALAKLKKIIVSAYEKVREAAERYKVDWRTAAQIVALYRLEMVYKERGIFP